MTSDKHYLAIDLGAESGRAILGALSNDRIELSEIHRFTTGPVNLPTKYPAGESRNVNDDSSLVWDFVRFWQEIMHCIRNVSQEVKVTSVGVDTWGVDFALLDKNGLLLSTPFHYRDSRTNGMMEKAFEKLSRERIYEITGIQFMQLNTLYQLYSLVYDDSPLMKIANKFLMIPDLINYWLTGRAVSEFTEATTSQIFDTRQGQWSGEIIQAMGFPQHIFPEIIEPGTIIGPMRASLTKELGCDLMVVAPPTHDTASAVAAIPAETDDFIWISSGTWSIIGTNMTEPVINAQSYASNFTNEGGVAGNFRFSKNVTGLWLVQQCRSQWQKEGKDFTYTELTALAKDAPHLKTIIDPDYSEFLHMGSMIEKIIQYCHLTVQPVPENEGEMIRAVLQGLALRYRYVIEQLEELSGKKTKTIHIVGGGTKNKLLNQFTADALGRKVITGPIEATATGNIIVQAIAMGDIHNWQEGVSIIKNSFDIQTYLPGDRSDWEIAYERFKKNLNKITLAF
ncbi:MAG: rhamnulokinase family protein [Chloroflexota bacterium]|nr:rhamnulokinase family protein [Chloroflexota bacterium]